MDAGPRMQYALAAMSIQDVTETIREKVGEDCGLAATLKFDMGDDGVVFIDATKVPNTVSNEDIEAQCTVGVSLSDLKSMMKGELDPMAAFSLGKLRLDGDMGVAMRLGNLMR
jgi:putative sterol carrier protein